PPGLGSEEAVIAVEFGGLVEGEAAVPLAGIAVVHFFDDVAAGGRGDDLATGSRGEGVDDGENRQQPAGYFEHKQCFYKYNRKAGDPLREWDERQVEEYYPHPGQWKAPDGCWHKSFSARRKFGTQQVLYTVK